MKRFRTFETRDGTMIKLNVDNGVYTMDTDLLRWNKFRFSAGRDSECKTAFDKLVRLAALCRGKIREQKNGEKLKEQN